MLHLGTKLGTDPMSGNLTARKVETAKPGKHSDGNNLYLVVPRVGAPKWVLRFTWRGQAKEMGLGGTRTVSLAEARGRAVDALRKVGRGINPIEDRNAVAVCPTFGAVADDVTEALSVGFRNEKHKAQWRMTLQIYAAPLRMKPVDAITTADVLDTLKPLWTQKPETASRLRGRIEKVLDAAKARGFRDGENPARWRGHLDHLLPKPSKLTRGHHAAMEYERVANFISRLRGREAVAASALEFCILTAARSGEVLGARWSEINLLERIWTIPAARMKAGREHRVPLSGRAISLAEQMQALRTNEFVFPGQAEGKPLSNMAMDMLLRRLDEHDVTVHGFRSSFRDWAGNVSTFPREVVETALAHVVGDKAEQAYRRSDAIQKRRKLMDSWAAYCEVSTDSKLLKFESRSR